MASEQIPEVNGQTGSGQTLAFVPFVFFVAKRIYGSAGLPRRSGTQVGAGAFQYKRAQQACAPTALSVPFPPGSVPFLVNP